MCFYFEKNSQNVAVDLEANLFVITHCWLPFSCCSLHLSRCPLFFICYSLLSTRRFLLSALCSLPFPFLLVSFCFLTVFLFSACCLLLFTFSYFIFWRFCVWVIMSFTYCTNKPNRWSGSRNFMLWSVS